MKKAIFAAACLMGLAFFSEAKAEEVLECQLSGQQDGGVNFSAPKQVTLEEAGSWTFEADGKNVPQAVVTTGRGTIAVTYTKEEQGKVYSYRYSFDDRKCDNEGTASGTLVKKLAYSSQGAVSMYDCTCVQD